MGGATEVQAKEDPLSRPAAEGRRRQQEGGGRAGRQDLHRRDDGRRP